MRSKTEVHPIEGPRWDSVVRAVLIAVGGAFEQCDCANCLPTAITASGSPTPPAARAERAPT